MARGLAREHARRLAAAAACVWLLTAFGVLLARLAPALAPSAHPHPTLHGTLGELASVIANNLRVLAAPFLLAVFHWPGGRITRRLGDVLITALIAQNTLAVGLALGRWGEPAAAIRAAAPARMDRPWHRWRGLADRP